MNNKEALKAALDGKHIIHKDAEDGACSFSWDGDKFVRNLVQDLR